MKLLDKILNKKEKKSKDSMEKPVHVIIKKVNNGMLQYVTEFYATEDRDDDFVLHYINEDMKFKEAVEKGEEELLQTLRHILKLGPNKTKSISEVDKEITQQEKLLGSIVDGKIEVEIEDKTKDEILDDEENEKLKEYEWQEVNIIDEKNKLKRLKVLKYIIENEGKGSFEQVDENGNKLIEYRIRDGILIPIRFNECESTMYEDTGTKVKHHNSTNKMIEDERRDEMQDKGQRVYNITMSILATIVLLSGIFFMNNLNERQKEMVSESKMDEIIASCEDIMLKSTLALSVGAESQKKFIDYAAKKLNETDPTKEETEEKSTIEFKKI